MNTKKYESIFLTEEASKCLLCYEAPCTAVCPNGQTPDAFVRSVRFENRSGAARFASPNACKDCSANCESACIRFDSPVRIRDMVLTGDHTPLPKPCDISIDFCGIHCENPFFLSSSIVAGSYEMCARALNAGWAGIVYKTIGFLVPEEVSPRFDATAKEGTPFIGFRNLEQISDHPLAENLDALRRLKRDFPEKVIVASIMGQNETEWERLARLVTEAGVDIIECNFSCPHMSGHGLGSDVGQNPELVSAYTAAARRGSTLPVLAKMTPNLANMEIPALAAVNAGADGIAAINTIKSLSGLNLSTLAPAPHIQGKSAVSGYSGKAVKPIALRFISDIAHHPDLKDTPLSGMGGIETWRDAAEFIALGCGTVQVTTAVMQYGYRIIDDLIAGLSAFLGENGYKNLADFRGSALKNITDASQLDRTSAEYPVFDRERCIGCGRCFVSCADAGHQAITFDSATRTPRLSGGKCVGCLLCRLVCPAAAIEHSKRVPKKAASAQGISA